jgi:hypothetical protein
MRKLNIYSKCMILLASSAVLLTVACEEDDVFTGSPDESGIAYTTLRGVVTTDETDLVSNQLFPVTVSLGDNPDTPAVDLLTFPVDVSVEVIAELPNTAKRTRRSIIIPAGENSAVGEMIAPSPDANNVLPFEMDCILFLNGITTGPEEDIRGFAGKQYKMVSDTLSFGYGDSALGGLNSRRLAVRFDFKGPYSGSGPNFNNLNILLKKNGSVMQSTSSIQGVSPAASTTRPLHGTLTNAGRYESLNFLDAKQILKLTNQTVQDSINGVYTVKSQSSSQGSSDRPHGFKVGDEVSIENIDGIGSAPLVVQIASVANPYTFTFNYSSSTHLLSNSFYQPVFVSKGDWSPFLAYSGNDMAVYNGNTYYCVNNVSANPAGNAYPNADPTNWTTVRPKFDWLNAPPPAQTWVAGTSSVPQTYRVNQVVQFTTFGGVVASYVCIRQHTITNGNVRPDADPTRWTTANLEIDSDVNNYTSTDTYTMEVYARTLGGVSTIGTTIAALPYRITLRYPNGDSKVIKSQFNDLSVQVSGSTPPANGIPKLQIVKTTVQGVSSYVVTPL